MTQGKKACFADKHPQGTTASPVILQALRDHLAGNKIACRAAHRIAGELSITPDALGVAIDLLEARICECQMGLFGHGLGRKAVKPAENVPQEMERAIRAALTHGRLCCADAWRIADAAGVARRSVADACEALKIKISRCQLGAF